MEKIQEKRDSLKTDATYQKGQSILYKGDAAKILYVNPVFTIKITNKSHIVCGNALLKDISLDRN